MPHVLIYGDSIFLTGLAAELQTLPDMQAICRSTLIDLGDLSAFDAVVVDFNDPGAADVFTLLRARPDLRLIGVNSASNAVTVLSGHVYLTKSLAEIATHLGGCD